MSDAKQRFARACAVLLAVLQAHCSSHHSNSPLDPFLSAGYAHCRCSPLPSCHPPLPRMRTRIVVHIPCALTPPLSRRRRWCAALPTAAELALVLVCAHCLHAASHTLCTAATSAGRWIRPSTPRDSPPASYWQWVVATGVATGTSMLQPCLGLFVGLVAPWCILRRSHVRDESIALSTQLAVREGFVSLLPTSA